MATGCLVRAEARPRSRASTHFAGDDYHTGRWPHEGVDFTGKRVGRHRHRVVGHPVDPGDRRAGEPPVRLPAHAELHGPAVQPAARSREGAEVGRALRGCAAKRHPTSRSEPATARERRGRALESTRRRNARRELEQPLSQRAGWHMFGAFADLLIDAGGQRDGGRVRRRKIRERVARPRRSPRS